MKILIVAMSNSIHTVRWVSQIADKGWDIHLFPSIDVGLIHPEMSNITVHVPLYGDKKCPDTLKVRGLPLFNDFLAKGVSSVLMKFRFYKNFQVNRLVNIIKKVKPDIIHSLEIQHAGYLTMEARNRMFDRFPPWIVTNWGSDIYLLGRLPEHEPKIREVLAACDFYSCECRRDVCLAKAYGFTGEVLPVFPNTGGFDLTRVAKLRRPGPVSERRLIMLKGYQHWAGRALTGLRALERCADLLRDYEVAIYSVSPDVILAAKLFSQSTGIRTTIVPKDTGHEEIMRLHGKARISIGLSISDGISTSFLEALVMGSFPIQSWTACADEWIENGKTGMLVPPEDPEEVEKAIRTSISDNELVDQAAAMNYATALEKLDKSRLKPMAVDIYNSVKYGKVTVL